MISPALLDAADDAEVQRRPGLSVLLLHLHRTLDYAEARPVRAWYIGDRMGWHRVTVYRALRTLVARGYLTRHAPADGTSDPRYTLVYARAVAQRQAA